MSHKFSIVFPATASDMCKHLKEEKKKVFTLVAEFLRDKWLSDVSINTTVCVSVKPHEGTIGLLVEIDWLVLLLLQRKKLSPRVIDKHNDGFMDVAMYLFLDVHLLATTVAQSIKSSAMVTYQYSSCLRLKCSGGVIKEDPWVANE